MLEYNPRFDLIALDKVRRNSWGTVGCFTNNDYTKRYYDNWWMWKQKIITLTNMVREYMPNTVVSHNNNW